LRDVEVNVINHEGIVLMVFVALGSINLAMPGAWSDLLVNIKLQGFEFWELVFVVFPVCFDLYLLLTYRAQSLPLRTAVRLRVLWRVYSL